MGIEALLSCKKMISRNQRSCLQSATASAVGNFIARANIGRWGNSSRMTDRRWSSSHNTSPALPICGTASFGKNVMAPVTLNGVVS